MTHAMRPSTLSTLGLGSVLDIFRRGSLPAHAEDLVDEVFGTDRGCLVISGANGIVGAGKTMQLGSRLEPFGVPVVALDFPGASDGIGARYPGLVQAFGDDRAARIMTNTTRLSYDGSSLPPQLDDLKPRFLLEAIPEVLELKREHYRVFRARYPDIDIRSVTSGFPQSELGVGIAHPAFPHEINKIYEVVEPKPSAISKLLWALGLQPMTVTDHWSFVLDVLFCGLTLAALRYHDATNMPFWKVDKYVRRLLGPNPFRAHDAIGAAGANYLTWSCLHHLADVYGELFRPTTSLVERKDSGQDWYPLNHFRPVVDWPMAASEIESFLGWTLGPIFQMASLLVHEQRSHLAQVNAIGELCAQFSRGVLAIIRAHGVDDATRIVETYHRLHPEAASGAWHPEALSRVDSPEWQQLYVNAEHDGAVGVVSIGRESYSADVDAELNRALDWLRSEGIERVILSGDFHLTTQLVGADTSEFYPALEDAEHGVAIARSWSRTARRLSTDFAVSVGFIGGKRCLGGMLELMLHCHWVVAADGAELGMPEVTLPVVPGMEGCHWPLRRTDAEHWPRVLTLLLEGRPVRATDALGWLVDSVAPLEQAVATCWALATGGDHGLTPRPLAEGVLSGISAALPTLPAASAEREAARKAILDTIVASCGVPLADALDVQARHSGAFMTSRECRRGVIGTVYKKTMVV